MTSEELFRALSAVDPDYLEHSENQISRRRSYLPRLAFIAAIMAVLTCTVFAASLIHNYLTSMKNSVVKESGIMENYRGETTLQEGWLSIELAAEANPDRPEWIKDCYLPMHFVENWEAEKLEISQAQNTSEWKEQRPDIWFKWIDSTGQYAEYRQTPIPIYTDENVWPYEEIKIGYNETVNTERCTIGEYELLCVEVPPSSVEAEGMVYSHPGYQRYFWSDGDYVFSLQVGFGTERSTVEQAVMTMTRVEDPDDYRNVIAIDSVAQETQTEPNQMTACGTVLFPAWLPEGWEQVLGRILPDGYFQFEWRYYPEGSSVWSCLTLEQGECGAYVQTAEEYESDTEAYTRLEWNILDCTVTVYLGDHIYEAFWTDGDVDYNLSFRGGAGMTEEDFTKILDSLNIVHDYTLLLTQ